GSEERRYKRCGQDEERVRRECKERGERQNCQYQIRKEGNCYVCEIRC
nr:Chain A, de novo design, hyper stable, disulfide-rich mini protein [synthetic construct]5JG9_B Chain B, de novo design, hyper stable, disulfide-rich mini protein [synthetic construct]5JG9_C Chain C, de novo design, hyper stable, disulfide-rich mini protein [synthetic construct]